MVSLAGTCHHGDVSVVETMIFLPLVSPTEITLIAALWAIFCVWDFVRARQRNLKGRVLSFMRRLALGATLCVALAGPAVPSVEVEQTSNVEIILAVDRTGSMVAEDWEGNQPRLEGAKRDIDTLLEATSGARYAIITWDSTARMELPLTTDGSAVESFAQSLHQEITEFSAGSSINRPLVEITEFLDSAVEQRPENVRYLVVISDGESTDLQDNGVSPGWQKVASLIDGGAVLGYGTAEGGPMKNYMVGEGAGDAYIPDPNNPDQPAISHLDEANLVQLGEQLGVETLINPSSSQIETLGQNFMEDAKRLDDGREIQSSYRYVLWPLGIIASVLLVWELGGVTWQLLRLRRTHAI